MFTYKNHADHPVVIPNVGEILPGEQKSVEVELRNPDLDTVQSAPAPQAPQQPIQPRPQPEPQNKENEE